MSLKLAQKPSVSARSRKSPRSGPDLETVVTKELTTVLDYMDELTDEVDVIKDKLDSVIESIRSLRCTVGHVVDQAWLSRKKTDD